MQGLQQADLLGDLLYSAGLSYFLVNDMADRLRAPVAGVVTVRQPSFGRVTLVAQPHFLFGLPRTVSFPSLEIDIDRLASLTVNQRNDHMAQVAYVQHSGLWQSAFEHLVLERLLSAANLPGEGVSAVKALASASRQGQRLYTVTLANSSQIMPQLMLDADVLRDIQDAVAAGKHALVAQSVVTVGEWTGVGYLLIDPETGSGAYRISGGANGGAAKFGAAPAFVTGLVIGMILASLIVVGAHGVLDPAAGVAALLCIAALGALVFILLTQLDEKERGCLAAGIGLTIALVFGFAVPSLSLAASVIQSIANMTRILTVSGGLGAGFEAGKCLLSRQT